MIAASLELFVVAVWILFLALLAVAAGLFVLLVRLAALIVGPFARRIRMRVS